LELSWAWRNRIESKTTIENDNRIGGLQCLEFAPAKESVRLLFSHANYSSVSFSFGKTLAGSLVSLGMATTTSITTTKGLVGHEMGKNTIPGNTSGFGETRHAGLSGEQATIATKWQNKKDNEWQQEDGTGAGGGSDISAILRPRLQGAGGRHRQTQTLLCDYLCKEK
jgi:hypothetical protein